MIKMKKSLQFVTGAKRLRQRVEDLEKELSEQKLVNQQQTLILLELIKVTNLNVQGNHFNWTVQSGVSHHYLSSDANDRANRPENVHFLTDPPLFYN